MRAMICSHLVVTFKLGRSQLAMVANGGSNSGAVNVREMIAEKKKKKNLSNFTEKIIPPILFLIASISLLTTVGIILTLITEAIEFFKRVPFWEFYTGTVLKPMSQNPEFGVLPLLNGTLISTAIAMLVAGPVGIMSAIYLSEYASDRARRVLKPM